MPCPDALRVQAYFDGEIDALAAAEVEEHIDSCAQCTALLHDLARTRAALRQEQNYFRAPEALRTRIGAALEQASSGGRAAAPRVRRHYGSRPFWTGALGGLGTGLAAALLAWMFFIPGLSHALADDLTTAHVRSLMPDHLIDVASSDRHTVKPWFAGHADVSPWVADFKDQGYRLIGGRTDFVAHQRSAVLVYEHGPHIINVFSWAGEHALPGQATRNGYHLIFWKVSDIQYCAVSDTGWDELLRLSQLMRDGGSHDQRD